MMPHLPRRGASFKYHYSLHVSEVKLREGVQVPPDSAFSIAWKRGEKLATTTPHNATGSSIMCNQTLSLVCTMYRAAAKTVGSPAFQGKESSVTLLQGRAGKALSSFKQLGKVQLDLAPFASIEEMSSDLKLVLLHDKIPVADVTLVVSSRWLRNFGRPKADGDLTSMSGSESASDVGSSKAGSSGSSGWPTADEDTESECVLSDAASDVGSALELDTDDEIAQMEAVSDAQHAANVKSLASLGTDKRGDKAAISPAGKSMGRRMPRLRFGMRTTAPSNGEPDDSLSASELATKLATAEEAREEAEEMAKQTQQALDNLTLQFEEAQAQLSAQGHQASLCDKLVSDVALHKAEIQKLSEEALQSNLALAEAQASSISAKEQVRRLTEEVGRLTVAAADASAATARADQAASGAAAMEESASKWKAQAEGLQVELAARDRELEVLRSSERMALLQMSRERTRRRVEGLSAVAQLERQAQLFASLAPSDEPPATEGSRSRRHQLEAQARLNEALLRLSDGLLAEGKKANSAGDPAGARSHFELSFVLLPRPVALLSAANMSLKLDDREMAAELYKRVVNAAQHEEATRTSAAEGEGVEEEEGGRGGLTEKLPQRAQGMSMPAPTEKELAMASRKLQEALGGGEVEGEGADAEAAREAREELVLERQLRLRLSTEVVRLQQQVEAARGGAPSPSHPSCMSEGGVGGSAIDESFGCQLEALTHQLHKAKAETARALREKAGLAREMLQQQKLQRKAKEQKLQLREANTKLEVAMMTKEGSPQAERRAHRAQTKPVKAQEAEEKDDTGEAMLRSVLQEHADRIMHLTNENNDLRAKLVAQEANEIG